MGKTNHVVIATAYDKKGKKIVQRTNSGKTHPYQKRLAEKVGENYKIYLHAEIHAIIAAKRVKIQTLTVERYRADKSFATAKPCPICRAAIAAAKIPLVLYTTPTGFVKL